MKRKGVGVVMSLLLVGSTVFVLGCAEQNSTAAQQVKISPSKIVVGTEHGNLTLKQIADIQPGLGTVMREYSRRFYITYYAAKNGKWDLANYELKEAREIQEVGEATRPAKAPMLKAFENSYLVPLAKTIKEKNWKAFKVAYNRAIPGCNGCHAANGKPFIKYVLPSIPPRIPSVK